MENPTHSFREINLILIEELQIKSKTVIVGVRERKKEDNFCAVYFARRKLF